MVCFDEKAMLGGCGGPQVKVSPESHDFYNENKDTIWDDIDKNVGSSPARVDVMRTRSKEVTRASRANDLLESTLSNSAMAVMLSFAFAPGAALITAIKYAGTGAGIAGAAQEWFYGSRTENGIYQEYCVLVTVYEGEYFGKPAKQTHCFYYRREKAEYQAGWSVIPECNKNDVQWSYRNEADLFPWR